jgi:nucleotide-binding universal stress UspA family protein
MFKHVLIPTDGSRVSRRAVRAAIVFAKELGARATAYHALEVPAYASGGFVPRSVLEQLDAGARKQAQSYLDEAVRLARGAGVPCDTLINRPEAVYEGIVNAARRKKCDVIFMGSHGRSELASLVVGSVTLKVLAHSKIPVVVFR